MVQKSPHLFRKAGSLASYWYCKRLYALPNISCKQLIVCWHLPEEWRPKNARNMLWRIFVCTTITYSHVPTILCAEHGRFLLHFLWQLYNKLFFTCTIVILSLVAKEYERGRGTGVTFIKGDFFIFYFHVRYSTLLHLLPLKFHCVGECWDWSQDCCDYGIGCQTL